MIADIIILIEHIAVSTPKVAVKAAGIGCRFNKVIRNLIHFNTQGDKAEYINGDNKDHHENNHADAHIDIALTAFCAQ